MPLLNVNKLILILRRNQTLMKLLCSGKISVSSSLSSGRYPDHPQPAAQIAAAIRASSEEVDAQWLVLLSQVQQDSFRWDTTGLLFLFFLFLELRHSSRQKPVPLERLVKERESGTVWKVMSSEERAHGGCEDT